MQWMIGTVRRSLFGLPVAAVAIALTPTAQAATFSFADTSTTLRNFSYNPTSIDTNTDTNTTSIAIDGVVITDANAAALLAPTRRLRTLSDSDSLAEGTGTNYLGAANSFSSIVGTFLVDSQKAFSFNFVSLMALTATADDTGFESATATSSVLFALFNDQTGDLLDSFGFDGQQSAGGHTDFSVTNSPFVKGKFFQKAFSYEAQPATLGTFVGSYSRLFDGPMSLSLVALQTNEVQVGAVCGR